MIQRLVRRFILPVISSTVKTVFILLPPAWGFAWVVIASYFLPTRGAHFFARAFGPISIRASQRQSVEQFTKFTRRISPIYSGIVLCQLGFYSDALNYLLLANSSRKSSVGLFWLAKAFFENGLFVDALLSLRICSASEAQNNAQFHHFLGLLYLLNGDVEWAILRLKTAIEIDANYAQPHQNIAARYPKHYVSNETDRVAGNDGVLFDAYNYLGQRVVHVGSGHLGVNFFSRAFEAQNKLRSEGVPISQELKNFLAEIGIFGTKFKILTWEWVTQVGHIGMLDILLRMKELDWWDGDAILLAPPKHVTNWPLLSLFKTRCRILIPTVSISIKLADEFFSLQRWQGISFNAWKFPSGEVVPWQEAGAITMQQWEAEGRTAPLRALFDENFSYSEVTAHHIFSDFKEHYGMRPDDWYACIHLRDAGYYGEVSGWGQTHRNADVDSYAKAIEYIVNQGGWVIQLGGKTAPVLPQMKRVIPYCRSKYKNSDMDLLLIRHAKFFVGTTSGLTNIAISFDVPCALVNCITTDAQLWSSKVRFVLKKIIVDNNRVLNQSELTSSPWRWRVFDAGVLTRYNARIEDNTVEEILEAVTEIEHFANGKLEHEADKDDQWVVKWRSILSLPYYYGAARPARYCVHQQGSIYLK